MEHAPKPLRPRRHPEIPGDTRRYPEIPGDTRKSRTNPETDEMSIYPIIATLLTTAFMGFLTHIIIVRDQTELAAVAAFATAMMLLIVARDLHTRRTIQKWWKEREREKSKAE